MANNKRMNLTLDFNQARKVQGQGSLLSSILASPDVNAVNTPDLEKIILGNPILNTPTPSTAAQAKTIIFPQTVTAEQEQFSEGFIDALNSLHNSNSQTASSDTSSVYNNDMDTQLPFMPTIKEEPNSGARSPPVSPVDMEDQERMKLERKRQRNRLAASKCRTRKLERISKLEEKVKFLKSDNSELVAAICQTRETVTALKEEVLEHMHAGCQIMV